MIEVQGKFVVGVGGVVDFTLHPLTVGAAMDALEAAIVVHGDGVNLMRVRPFEYANMIFVDGSPAGVDWVLKLTTHDYDILNQVAGELAKKLSAPTVG